MSRLPTLLATGFAAVLPAGLAAQQVPDPYDALTAFVNFFEPERSASLGLSGFDGRVTDLSEEGLAARDLGYRRLRSNLAAAPLFPRAAEALAPLLDPRRFLDRRIVSFSQARPWERSPLYYVRATARAMVQSELNPALSTDERRRALTVRARQLPHTLASADGVLVNPPHILVAEAMQEARELEEWLGRLNRRYGGFPESADKWALERAVGDLTVAVTGYRAYLDSAWLSASNDHAALGAEFLGEMARGFGLDGIYHAVELLDHAVAGTRPHPPASDTPPETGDVFPSRAAGFGRPNRAQVVSALAAQWPGVGTEPRITLDVGQPVPGYASVLVAVPPGAAKTEVRGLGMHAAEYGEPLSAQAVLELAAAEATWYDALTTGLGLRLPSPGQAARAGPEPRAQTAAPPAQVVVAWDALAGAARWLALALAAQSDDPAWHAGREAFREAVAARAAFGVHMGNTGVQGAVQRLREQADVSDGRARRMLAGLVSDPLAIFYPALGSALMELWRQQGQPPLGEFFMATLGR